MAHLRESRGPTTYSIRRLTITYGVLLALIAACLLVFAMAMLDIVPSQNDDAHIVNISGRQRMLSQRLFKVLLQMSDEETAAGREKFREEIRELTGQWVTAQEYLSGTDPSHPAVRSDSIVTMIRMQEPYFRPMVATCERVVAGRHDDTLRVRQAIAVMEENEPSFLILQEQITNRFQYEADSRLQMLGAVATGSFIILFLLIVVEGFVVFRPMVGQIERYIATLTCANEELRAATEAKNLSEMNMRRLLSVYPDMTLVFDEKGTYTDIFTSSDHLLYRSRDFLLGKRLHDVFPPEQADSFLRAIATAIETLEPYTFTYVLSLPSGDVSFRATTTFFENGGGHHHAVMFIRDITKELEAENRELLYRQKLLQTIIETQESERLRIARDMHDGIGQMFAVLKLNVATLRREDEGELFDDVLESIDTIVNELRAIAWNLMPVSLERFGLASTLQSEAEILQRRFGIVVRYTAETLHERYPAAIEICIYRIAQELLANIIKHSRAHIASVTLTERQGMLRLEISDDGCGFEMSPQPNGYAGRGLISIQSRVLAFGGTVFFDSSKEAGSRACIEIPLP